MRKVYSKKPVMNTLLNIGNYFGEFSSPLMPWLVFFGVGSIPLFVWLFIFQLRIPWLPVVIFEILWLIPVAIYSFLDVKRIVNDYLKSIYDSYAVADDIVHVKFISEDGLIEYDNGQVAYIVYGYPKEYLSDAKFSVDLEQFEDELDAFDWDYYMQNDVDEITMESGVDKFSRYKDTRVIQDRLNQAKYQDEYTRTHTGVYKLVYLVKIRKSNWRTARYRLEDIISSQIAECFNEIYIADIDQVNDIMSRDTCMFMDLYKMLLNKHNASDIGSSRMMWYEDEVPAELKKNTEDFKIGLEERRASLNDR